MSASYASRFNAAYYHAYIILNILCPGVIITVTLKSSYKNGTVKQTKRACLHMKIMKSCRRIHTGTRSMHTAFLLPDPSLLLLLPRSQQCLKLWYAAQQATGSPYCGSLYSPFLPFSIPPSFQLSSLPPSVPPSLDHSAPSSRLIESQCCRSAT